MAEAAPDLLRPDEGPAFARAVLPDGTRLLVGAVRCEAGQLRTAVPVAVAESWLVPTGAWRGEVVLATGERLAFDGSGGRTVGAGDDGYLTLCDPAPAAHDWDLARIELRARP